MKKIYLAGGCFWGVQKFIDQFDGIQSTVVGYANGNTEYPRYEDVKAQKSGHTETVEVIYDENVISLKEILTKFYIVIDPTSLNKQGEDEGISYRTGIYYVDDEDKDIILDVMNNESKKYDKQCVVEFLPLENFYPAEDYHQKYLEKNPNGYCHIDGCFFRLNDSI